MKKENRGGGNIRMQSGTFGCKCGMFKERKWMLGKREMRGSEQIEEKEIDG